MQVTDDTVLMRTHQLQSGAVQKTDATNTRRFVELHGKDVRYNAAWKKWIVWNAKHWEIDEGETFVYEKISDTINKMYADLLKTDDMEERMEIEKHAIKSESWRRRESMVKGATKKSEINIKCDALDKNPWLLNVENGTCDVEHGVFKDHDRNDLITKIANVIYDPAAECPVWKQFIREIMNYNTELIDFLQVAAGWSITADVSEQVMFILFGSGANGKSTFLNTISHVLGDYATATQTETFMKQNGEKQTNDLARLRGARFVTTAEADAGAKLSESLVKQITGNDKITARFLYSEYFTFQPTFKIFMATNHKPTITGTDHGIWRRIRLVPFTTTIADDKQDKNLEQKLRAEASGILNWLLEGAMRWRKEGLKTPQEILNATDEYRAEMDVIGNFIKECCIQDDPSNKIRIRELFKAYQSWCDGNNEHARSERFFGLRLKEIGMTQIRTSEARFWSGIALRATPS